MVDNKIVRNAREWRDPLALPAELRSIGKQICPEWPQASHLFGSSAEARDILEHAADELEKFQAGMAAKAD